MYLHLEQSSSLALGVAWNGWWVFITRGLGSAIRSGWVVLTHLASSKNGTRCPMGWVLVLPLLRICHVISWSQVVPWNSTKMIYRKDSFPVLETYLWRKIFALRAKTLSIGYTGHVIYDHLDPTFHWWRPWDNVEIYQFFSKGFCSEYEYFSSYKNECL